MRPALAGDTYRAHDYTIQLRAIVRQWQYLAAVMITLVGQREPTKGNCMARRPGQISPTALRSAMARRGVSVDDVAVHLDTSTTAVYGWLSARRVPEPPALVALARALGLRPADLTLVSESEERLHDLRIHAGLLQAEAATAAGLRQPQLSKMERGVAVPREDLADALASAYSLSVNRVMEAWQRTREDRRRHAESKLS